MPFPAALSHDRRKEAARLYQSGLSTQQVAERLGVSLNATFYALRSLGIKRRAIQESNRLRFEARPLSYKLKTKLTVQEENLRLAAVMLYWAEGHKAGKQTNLDFANSDSTMALLFRKFLAKICRVDEQRIRCHIYCYEGQDVAALTNYWSKLLSVPKRQFIKPYVKKAAIPGPRGARMTHGLVHICYCDKKLVRQMLAWISEYSRNLTK